MTVGGDSSKEAPRHEVPSHEAPRDEASRRAALPRRRRAGGEGSSVRQGNVARVVEALRIEGPSSQAGLARRTQLSAATINTIVRDLRADGIAEIQPINGRESVVTLSASRGLIMSVQVNVASIRAALFDFGDRTRHDVVLRLGEGLDVPGGSPDTVVGMVRQLVFANGLTSSDLAGVAVAMQAPVARATGAITSWARSDMPGWDHVPIAAVLAESLGVPVLAENDANLAALAEWTWGSGRGSTDFLYVMCSSRIGGGLILDGRIHRGGDGLAGEIGHMVVEQNGPVCFCGNRGCLTTFTSERSLLATLEEAAGRSRHSLREVIDNARAGDPACVRVLNEAGRYLGRAFANIAKVVSPNVIAIGGLLGAAGPLVFDGLTSSVEINSMRVASPGIQLRMADIGADATLFGGAAAMLDHLGEGVYALPDWMKQTKRTQLFSI